MGNGALLRLVYLYAPYRRVVVRVCVWIKYVFSRRRGKRSCAASGVFVSLLSPLVATAVCYGYAAGAPSIPNHASQIEPHLTNHRPAHGLAPMGYTIADPPASCCSAVRRPSCPSADPHQGLG